MDFQLNQKFNYWNAIKYGIDNIGKEIEISDIEKAFKGKTRAVEDLDNPEVLATSHAYPGQEHLGLSFEDDNFYGFIDFDLMPTSLLTVLSGRDKKLVNFKAQIFGKKAFLWYIPLKRTKAEVYLNLKKRHGLPNDFGRFSEENKKEFARTAQLLRDAYKPFGVNPKEISIWFIEKEGTCYPSSFYYFKGKRKAPPFLSFAITEMFQYSSVTKFQELVKQKTGEAYKKLKANRKFQERLAKKSSLSKIFDMPLDMQYKFLTKEKLAKLSFEEQLAYREAQKKNRLRNEKLILQGLNEGVLSSDEKEHNNDSIKNEQK